MKGMMIMNPISTKAQRKIMFIPIINIFNLFICLLNCCCKRIPMITFLKVYLSLFGYTLPPALVYGILLHIFPTFEQVLTPLAIYLIPLIMSFGLIKFQEKYITD